MANAETGQTLQGRAYGKSLRHSSPHQAHADSITAPEGRDILTLIEESNQGRIPPLVPIRHARMLESPFTFYRGTAMIQAADLAGSPSSGLIVQACGDCHLSNFGGFATPERQLIFDVNDFDETYPAPWEWDLKRLVASFIVAARWRGFAADVGAEAVKACFKQYRHSLARLASLSTLDIWHYCIDWADIAAAAQGNKRAKRLIKGYVGKARQQSSESVFVKIVNTDGKTPRFMDNPPFLYHPAAHEYDVHQEASAFLAQYAASLRDDYRALFKRFTFVDAAVKVVGVGSVGNRCLVALLMGPRQDPLVLQIKEAGPSVLHGRAAAQHYDNHGQRIVAGQRLTQAASDLFLGWAETSDGRDFYVRQLRDMKVSVEIEDLSEKLFIRYARLCGAALARAHAKTGDAAAIAGYIGSGKDLGPALLHYAAAYADQVNEDYQAFAAAAQAGRFAVADTTTG